MVGQEGINSLVLAGGKSSRMGEDKALMRLGKKPLIIEAELRTTKVGLAYVTTPSATRSVRT